MPLEAPSVMVLGVDDFGTGVAGVVLVTLVCLDVSGDVVSLEDLRSGLTDGCFVMNESDFIRELLGSLHGLLNHWHLGVRLWLSSSADSRLL